MKGIYKYSYCNVEGNTDVGCKRKANEDWLDSFESDNGLVAVVCDGMGGHVGGQIASHVAVDAIRNFLSTRFFDDARTAIVQACDAANQAILQRASQQPELMGMGSTCVMLIVRDGKVYIGSVGDSRIYLVRSRTIKQLTKDQSYVQMLVDAGQITAEQAEHHPRKNEITNALGLQNMKPATVLETPINPEAGDCFLLCSDGLSGMVSDAEIAKITGNQGKMSQRDRVNALIQKAREHGGLDNITCQIVEFSLTPESAETKAKKNKSILKYGFIAGAAALLIGAFLFFLKGNDEENMKEETERVETKSSTDNGSRGEIRPLITDTIFFDNKNSSQVMDIDTLNRSIHYSLTKNLNFPNETSLDTASLMQQISNGYKIEKDTGIYKITLNADAKGELVLYFKTRENNKDSIVVYSFVLKKTQKGANTQTPQTRDEKDLKNNKRNGKVIFDKSKNPSSKDDAPETQKESDNIEKNGFTSV